MSFLAATLPTAAALPYLHQVKLCIPCSLSRCRKTLPVLSSSNANVTVFIPHKHSSPEGKLPAGTPHLCCLMEINELFLKVRQKHVNNFWFHNVQVPLKKLVKRLDFPVLNHFSCCCLWNPFSKPLLGFLCSIQSSLFLCHFLFSAKPLSFTFHALSPHFLSPNFLLNSAFTFSNCLTVSSPKCFPLILSSTGKTTSLLFDFNPASIAPLSTLKTTEP